MNQKTVLRVAGFFLLLSCALALGGWIFGRIHGRTICTKQDATKATIAQVCRAVDLFCQDQHRFPEHLTDLVARPAYVESQKWPPGGYITEQPLDGWGRDLIFQVPGTKGRRFNVISLGADGRIGGENQDIDLENNPKGD